ncbi:very short patch repair endonuclease [Burkholderia gladioli]|uniref:very short patch repair endonuclease n=1 Tax=Burkholderia gladioli TaxID=28095 RepID=UPI003FA5DBC0
MVLGDPVAVRSANMARIRGKDTRPELLLRKALWRQGLRYRLGVKVEGTRPDLVFCAQRVVVFVDGCFWHGCPCHYVRPRSGAEFWAAKLAANTTRDRRQTRLLLDAGWTVLRIWEHEINSDLEGVLDRLVNVCIGPNLPFSSRMIVVCVKESESSPGREYWYLEDLLDSSHSCVEVRDRKAPLRRHGQNPADGR